MAQKHIEGGEEGCIRGSAPGRSKETASVLCVGRNGVRYERRVATGCK